MSDKDKKDKGEAKPERKAPVWRPFGQPVTADDVGEPPVPPPPKKVIKPPAKTPASERFPRKGKRLGECTICKEPILEGDSHQTVRGQGLRCVRCEIK